MFIKLTPTTYIGSTYSYYPHAVKLQSSYRQIILYKNMIYKINYNSIKKVVNNI